MTPLSRLFAALALAVALLPAADAGEPVQPIRLQFDPADILQAVAHRMNVTLRPEIPLPTILLQSKTPLARFQDAIAVQWKFRPPVYSNAYVVARNEIYLMDDPEYYVRINRTLDESLAHEFAHYVQVHYLNADLADPSCESDAIAVQALFATPRIAATAGLPQG
jgi:hypothetical protein